MHRTSIQELDVISPAGCLQVHKVYRKLLKVEELKLRSQNQSGNFNEVSKLSKQ